MKGLDHAGTDPMEMTPDRRKALSDISEAKVLCIKISWIIGKSRL